MTDEIKLVSERDPKEIAAQRARTKLNWATKELAANILRIIAGAGRTDKIMPVVAAYEKLNELAGSASASEATIEQALQSLDWRANDPNYTRPTDADLARREDDGTDKVERTKDDIVQAVLRLVAAQLSAQPTQEAHSNNQLLEAIRRFNKEWEAHRQRLSVKPSTERMIIQKKES